MDNIRGKILELAQLELQRANSIHKPKFASRHEGYAVMKEEKEEAEDEFKKIFVNLYHYQTGIRLMFDVFWGKIKRDEFKESLEKTINELQDSSVNLIEESIQFLAMCEKFKALLEEEE